MTDGGRPEQHEPDETAPFSGFGARPVSPSGDRADATWATYGEGPTRPEPEPGPTYGQVPQAYGQPAYGQPGPTPYGAYGPGMFARAHGGATTAMVLGIVSVTSALLTPFVCITLPLVLTGPFAIGLGITSGRAIRREPQTYNNPWAATTGLITGIIGTVIGVGMLLLVVFFFGLFALAASGG